MAPQVFSNEQIVREKREREREREREKSDTYYLTERLGFELQ